MYITIPTFFASSIQDSGGTEVNLPYQCGLLPGSWFIMLGIYVRMAESVAYQEYQGVPRSTKEYQGGSPLGDDVILSAEPLLPRIGLMEAKKGCLEC